MDGRQVAKGDELQFVQGDMSVVEVDGGDCRRPCREIGKNVAVAGCDGDQVTVRLKLQYFEIEYGVFPDLRIDEPAER